MSDIKDENFEDDSFYDDALDENFDFDEADYAEEESFDDVLDDDFDFGSEFEENFEGDDDTSSTEEGDFDGETFGEKKQSRFSLSFNTMVIIGAVIVGAIVMVMQLNKTGQKITAASPQQEQFATALKMEGAFEGPGKIKQEDIQSVELDNIEDDGANKGFLFDADEVKPDLINIEDFDLGKLDAPPMPSPIVADETNIDLAEEDFAQIDVEQPRSPFEDAFSTFGDDKPNELTKVEQIVEAPVKKADEVKTLSKDVVLVEPVIEPTPKSELKKQLETKISTLEDVKKEKDAIQSEIKESSQKIVEAQTSSDVKSEDIAILITKLEGITARLNGMDQKITNLQNSKMITKTSNAVKAKIPVQKSPRTQAPKKVVKKTIVTKVTKKKSPSVSSKITWELRAAQPGKAWVSQIGQRDMRPIVVGDELVSIGRIKAIQYTNNKWVVTGSNGIIRQK